jgi:HEAT repeat protein
VSGLPPDDQPDEVYMGPVGPIPVHYDDDLRLADERAAWSNAAKIAQSLITADELIGGMRHSNWRVRHDVVDRLVARAGDDDRAIPTLIAAIDSDPAWEVRDAAVMALRWPDDDRVRAVLERALDDGHPEVRWSASYKLSQFG